MACGNSTRHVEHAETTALSRPAREPRREAKVREAQRRGPIVVEDQKVIGLDVAVDDPLAIAKLCQTASFQTLPTC